jgi:hypothetical protein
MNRPLFDRMEQLFTELAAAGEKITQYYAPTPFRPEVMRWSIQR